jgi:hypothetical protein
MWTLRDVSFIMQKVQSLSYSNAFSCIRFMNILPQYHELHTCQECETEYRHSCSLCSRDVSRDISVCNTISWTTGIRILAGVVSVRVEIDRLWGSCRPSLSPWVGTPEVSIAVFWTFYIVNFIKSINYLSGASSTPVFMGKYVFYSVR